MLTFIIIIILNALVMGLFIYWGRARIMEASDSDKLLGPVTREVESMLIQINKTSLDAVTILDDKIMNLKEELEEADKRIRMLQENREKQAHSTYTHLDPGPVSLNITPPRDEKSEILNLRDQGLDPGAIAARMGTTVGEVEMILSLNPGK